MSQEDAECAIYSEFADDLEFQELIEMFISSVPEKKEQISEYHKSNDIEHLEIVAHQLKGVGGGYGYPGLTDVSAKLETVCKNNSLDDLDVKVEELLEYLNRLSM